MRYIPGQRVVWRHVPRGGYGYVLRVPATVEKHHESGRVTILVETRWNAWKRRVVRAESLADDSPAPAVSAVPCHPNPNERNTP